MLAQAKTIVNTGEVRFQDSVEDVKHRLEELKVDARMQYRKAHFNGTKVLFEVVVTTEPKISAFLQNDNIPKTPIHPSIVKRIERFNNPIIPEYDSLNTKKIVKNLKGLTTWNLFKVDRRERQTKNRKTIFQAIDREHRRNLSL
jgi:hypothetical protein